MGLELDHVFILVKPEAIVAGLLLSIGMKESFSRDHKGQGTSNRRFEFSNGMLELLWVRDAEEAMNGPGRDLHFLKRTENPLFSPFGIILRKKRNAYKKLPFDGWRYQPDYFMPPMSFHVGINSKNFIEPLCIYAPFIEVSSRKMARGTFNAISNVKIHTIAKDTSDILNIMDKIDRLSIVKGNEHLMGITFDEGRSGLSKDFRPDLPLIIHW